MINNEKVGVGIVTCNRKESFYALCTKILSLDYIDYVVVCKNKDINYGDFCPSTIINNKFIYINVLDDLGVGHCKNKCLIKLLELNCDHLFIIEDDVEIIDEIVFEKYVMTAKHFKLGHLNWNTLPNLQNNTTYTINADGYSLAISSRLCGCFSYFSRNALMFCGLFDEFHYINALEHVEHTYRLSLMNFTTPFYAFAGVTNSELWLTNIGENGQSTINYGTDIYNKRLQNASNYFNFVYKHTLSTIRRPTFD